MSRKPRSDSKLLNLPDEDQAQAYDAVKRLGYTKARLWIAENLGVKVSTGALHAAYQYWAQQESENRILQAVTGADAILGAAADNLPRIDQAMEAALKQAAFEAVLTKDEDGLTKLTNVLLRIQKAALDEKQLELQIDRFQFDAAKAALDNVATLKSIQSDRSMSSDDKITAARRKLFSVIPEDGE
ncbi:hypothetical protein EGM51_10675 [Verrucomicrobia bacterium S94]|nr:hypothetical protein EGM51_10675 [Verrucomicrobia bacterium S94]